MGSENRALVLAAAFVEQADYHQQQGRGPDSEAEIVARALIKHDELIKDTVAYLKRQDVRFEGGKVASMWSLLNPALQERLDPCDGADTMSGLPAHLADISSSQQCDRCGRKTWTVTAFFSECAMPQPDGTRCSGRFS